MLYKFDQKTLAYREVKRPNERYFLLVAALIFFLSLNISSRSGKEATEERVMVILAERNQFSTEKLISKIKEMNFQFPYIIYGQALLETDHFRSRLFMENNNIFGMKTATKRLNLSHGTQYDHAWYGNWMDSVYDYGFYYASYLSKITKEEEYFSYLSQYYAEDPNYVLKLKEIIVSEKLESLFN